MTEPRPEEGNLKREFQTLGENLKGLVKAAWESEGRKKIERDIEDGLVDLGKSLEALVKEISEGPAVKRLQDEFDDFQERFQSGEVQTKARDELLEALQKINSELRAAVGKMMGEEPPEGPTEST